jgi:hypothetical protein
MKRKMTRNLKSEERVNILLGLLEVSQKDDANCERTHGQYHFLCFPCNPEETMHLCSTKSPPHRDGRSLSFGRRPDALAHGKQECYDTDHSHSLVALRLVRDAIGTAGACPSDGVQTPWRTASKNVMIQTIRTHLSHSASSERLNPIAPTFTETKY